MAPNYGFGSFVANVKCVSETLVFRDANQFVHNTYHVTIEKGLRKRLLLQLMSTKISPPLTFTQITSESSEFRFQDFKLTIDFGHIAQS